MEEPKIESPYVRGQTAWRDYYVDVLRPRCYAIGIALALLVAYGLWWFFAVR